MENPLPSNCDAAIELKKRQKDNPPGIIDHSGNGHDRVHSLFELLKPKLPGRVKERDKKGMLAVGEVGLDGPDAYLEKFHDGSQAIIITSGLLRLFYYVACDVISLQSNHLENYKSDIHLSPGDTAFRIASLLQQVREGSPWKGYTLDTYALTLSPEQKEKTQNLYQAMVFFTLIHEIGHVSVETATAEPVYSSQELEADFVAFMMLLSVSDQFMLDQCLIGALLSLQLFVSLESTGYQFNDPKTSLAERIAKLKAYSVVDPARQYLGIKGLGQLIISFAFLDDLFKRVGAVLQFMNLVKGGGGPSAGKVKLLPTGPTLAFRKLQELQRQYPPWEYDSEGGRLDRTKYILEKLGPIAAKVDLNGLGWVAVGEVGGGEPVSSIQVFEDGSKLIVFNSGLFELILAVSRYLHTRVAVEPAAPEKPNSIWPLSAVVLHIVELFNELESEGLRPFSNILLPPALWEPQALHWWLLGKKLDPLADGQYRAAQELAEGAEMFILLTRLYECNVEANSEIPAEFTGESAAVMFFVFGVMDFGYRKTLPGILLAVRVRDWVELVWPSLKRPKYLTPQMVTSANWGMSGSLDSVRYLKETGSFFEWIMEQVDYGLAHGVDETTLPKTGTRLIDKAAEELLLAGDCIAWYLATGILFCVQENGKREDVLVVLMRLAQGLSQPALERLADSLFERVSIKLVLEPHLPGRAVAEQEVELLGWLITQLPENMKHIFEAAQVRWKAKRP